MSGITLGVCGDESGQREKLPPVQPLGRARASVTPEAAPMTGMAVKESIGLRSLAGYPAILGTPFMAGVRDARFGGGVLGAGATGWDGYNG